MNSTSSANIQPKVISLWPDEAVGTTDWPETEQEVTIPGGLPLKVVRNVSRPTLTAYYPEPSTINGLAVIVCPGGAFHFLAIEQEGIQVAEWLTARGITAFVLKYRLLHTGDDFPACVWQNLNDQDKMTELMRPLIPLVIADGLQAVRLVRQHAMEWGVEPDRIGIMGFSAGGMVTGNVALHYDLDSRPDFAAPIYGASWEPGPVPTDAPPLFLLCATNDELAPFSIRLYSDWNAAGHSVELHIYSKGGHGFGMHKQGLPSDAWIERFAEWLQAQNFLDNL
jgi:acetyl esterase/lipase